MGVASILIAAIPLIAGTRITPIPQQIDPITGAVLGAGFGAALGTVVALLSGRDYVHEAAVFGSCGFLLGAGFPLAALVLQSL